MELTRKQELYLISIGLNHILSQHIHSKPRALKSPKGPTPVNQEFVNGVKRTMSAKARKAISKRMKAMWAEKRGNK